MPKISYDIDLFDYDCTSDIQSITSNNLFAKNYYYPGGLEGYTNPNIIDEPWDDFAWKNILWEFSSNPTDLSQYFAATTALDKLVVLNNNSPDGIITLRPYSVTQIINPGCFSPIQGDLDGDGLVSTTDIIQLVNYILNIDILYVNSGDLNSDSFMNVIDIIAIVNIILNGNE